MFNQEEYPFLYVPGYMENTSLVWEKILSIGVKYDFKKGQYILTRNEKNGIWYITKGVIKFISEDYNSDNDAILYMIGKGCIARESINSTYYNFSNLMKSKSVSDVSLYEFDKSLLSDTNFILNYPDLIKNYIETLSIKFISHIMLFSIRRLQSTLQKVSYFIYGFYLLRGNKLNFSPPFSQSQLGRLLGISHFTINRAIKELKVRKILHSYTKTNIRISNISELRDLAYKY